MKTIKETIESISKVDRALEKEVNAHLDDLTKPPGSLGNLEEYARRFCLITKSTKPILNKKKIFTFAADHGVAEEGVSAFPQEVTFQMVLNMLNQTAAINVLSQHHGIETTVVDVGVKGEFEDLPGLVKKKVSHGTKNMSVGPAMTIEETEQAIQVGIDCAQKAVNEGFHILGTGDMGIANTTPSAALMACLLPCDVAGITGIGTGIDSAGVENKIKVIEKSLEVNSELLGDPLTALSAVGGLEIAAICGLILGAASNKTPVVVDGFISSAAALVACKMSKNVKEYLFFSHASAEKGYAKFSEIFKVDAMLHLQMRLGEGTGAALAISLIEASVKIYNEMATFSSAQVSNKG